MSTAECRACAGGWPPAEAFIADCGPAKAYLHEDQYFPGWTLLVLSRHATELWELAANERHALIDGVAALGQALAGVYDARKLNYELLGNELPHIHWHLVPRRADDPAPRRPVWTHAHEARVLSAAERRARIDAIRARLPR